jgi:hypothetical protein
MQPGTLVFDFPPPPLWFQVLWALFLLAIVLGYSAHAYTYSHVSQELQEEAARQMSAVLWSGAKA